MPGSVEDNEQRALDNVGYMMFAHACHLNKLLALSLFRLQLGNADVTERLLTFCAAASAPPVCGCVQCLWSTSPWVFEPEQGNSGVVIIEAFL